MASPIDLRRAGASRRDPPPAPGHNAEAKREGSGGRPRSPGAEAPGEREQRPGRAGSAKGPERGALYIGVLVGGDRYELGLGEGEGLHSARLVGVLRPVFVHLHHMQAGLVLVEGLQNHHLSGRGRGGRGPRG